MPIRASVLALVALSALSLAGCATGSGAAPSASSTGPTPTLVSAPVASIEDAAARAIATDPRFAGATQVQADSIGLTKWWTGVTLASGSFEIDVTIGWGDCPAGCISHHTWTFEVAADGTVTPRGESGDPAPTGP